MTKKDFYYIKTFGFINWLSSKIDKLTFSYRWKKALKKAHKYDRGFYDQ